MEHSINELIRYNNKLYTLKAVNEMSAVKDIGRGGISRVHSRICNYSIAEGSFKYIDTNGERTAWQFGCYKFYDSKEERDRARGDYQRAQEELHLRNALLKTIEELPTEKLIEIVKSL